MANLVVHFEIHASEPQKLIDFYSELFGWKFIQFIIPVQRNNRLFFRNKWWIITELLTID